MLATFLFHENFALAIEIIGTVAFATSGAFAAMQHRLDPFGVLIIAFATSVGGGTIRDLLLGVPVFWMHDMLICSVAFITTILAMIFKSIEKNFKNTLFIFDSLGLGLFTIIGVQKGISAGLHPVICITLGTITGCFGGVLRDILINRIPLLLRKEIYATACIIGGTTFLLLNNIPGIPKEFIQIITISIIVIIRIIAVKFKLHMPLIYQSDASD
ncbi:MAG: trimeric intracellular cation channel family protein [Flavobacteriaceae bacterium]|nr:trimeric intracellular cation channel family protein [Flavobacteriaceae bacterium]